VMVSDAFAHARFKYFPEAGEDPYHSFLGVPLVEGGTLQGVLVVQTVEPRTFSANETRMLVAVAAQLAPLVSEARLIDPVVAAAHQSEQSLPNRTPPEPATLRGTALSRGVGFGQAYLINSFKGWQLSTERRSTDKVAEEQRLARALDAARDEIARLS